MGLFRFMFGARPSAEELAWVPARFPGTGIRHGDRYAELQLPASHRDARVIYHSYSTSTGKSSSTHYRTFIVLPLPPSHGWVRVTGGGCLVPSAPNLAESNAGTNDPELMRKFLSPDAYRASQSLGASEYELAPTVLFIKFNRWKITEEQLMPVLHRVPPILDAAIEAKEEANRAHMKMLKGLFDEPVLPQRRRENRFPDVLMRRGNMDLLFRLQTDVKLQMSSIPSAERQYWEVGPFMALTADIRSKDTLKVFPQNIWHAIGSLVGYQDIKIGNAEFDKAFVVKTGRDSFAREVLSADVQKSLLRVKELGRGRAKFDISRSSTSLFTDDIPEGASAIEEFVRNAFGILGAVFPSLKAATKIEVVEERTGETGECQVCGEEMRREQSIVRCSRCSTPHHKECRDYLGGCSTFGCMRV